MADPYRPSEAKRFADILSDYAIAEAHTVVLLEGTRRDNAQLVRAVAAMARGLDPMNGPFVTPVTPAEREMIYAMGARQLPKRYGDLATFGGKAALATAAASIATMEDVPLADTQMAVFLVRNTPEYIKALGEMLKLTLTDTTPVTGPIVADAADELLILAMEEAKSPTSLPEDTPLMAYEAARVILDRYIARIKAEVAAEQAATDAGASSSAA